MTQERKLRKDGVQLAPEGLKPYLNMVRTAERLHHTNPTLADDWRGKAYVKLHDVLEVREWAMLLDGGYPDGVEDIESLPGLRRHQPKSRREIVNEVLADLKRNPEWFDKKPPTEVDKQAARGMKTNLTALIDKVNKR